MIFHTVLIGGLEHVIYLFIYTYIYILGMSSSQLTNSSFFRGVGIPPTSLAFCYKWNRTMTSKKIPFSMDYQGLTMHIVGAISTWVCLKIWGKHPKLMAKLTFTLW